VRIPLLDWVRQLAGHGEYNPQDRPDVNVEAGVGNKQFGAIERINFVGLSNCGDRRTIEVLNRRTSGHYARMSDAT
jgi:hypothetical protein